MAVLFNLEVSAWFFLTIEAPLGIQMFPILFCDRNFVDERFVSLDLASVQRIIGAK